MRSNNLQYVPRLDHLRFLAAAIVFVFHWYHHFFGHWQANPVMNGTAMMVDGYTGVSLFFVLSGYLFMTIGLSADGPIHYGRFLYNRVLRIFPLFTFIFMIALSLTRDKFQPDHLLYFFATNLGLTAPTSSHFITGAAWTISVEFTFYLVFPFLVRFAMEQGVSYLPRLIGLLLVFKVGGYLVAERSNLMFYSTLLGRFDQFLIGMWVAQLFSGRVSARRLPGIVPLAALALMFLLVEAQGHWASFLVEAPKNRWWVLWPTIEAVGWSLVVVSYLGWRGSLPRWLNLWFERGGEISFSLYLWHAVVIFIVERFVKIPSLSGIRAIDTAAVFMLTAMLTWWISRLSYTTIEQPFLGLRKRYVDGG
ncbi:acyltransferase family protein [Propionivibrio limicola]|uniref:acyltransferase family protein n=1 Tax=Propionivibrio limicola TaxID=167645 RepID=UPI001291B722|nr:acyltransferase [Propionivibrio limicola]